jgi:hypothetical protein
MFIFNSSRDKNIFLAIILFGFIASPVGAAWQTQWSLGADVEYSDNINRADSDGDDDDATFLIPRGSINAIHEGPNFDAQIGLLNQYRSRLSGDQGSNNNFDIDGLLNWKIAPGLFEWSVEDRFNSEFPIDIRAQPNESNSQDINTFSTGPSFTPRIFNRTNLIFEARYSRTDAEESDIDNDRLQAVVGIERQLTPNSSLSLNYLYEDTDFDENNIDLLVGNIDFDRETYFLEYALARQSLNIVAQVGYTDITRDEGPNQNSGGDNSSINLDYILNSTSSLNVTAYKEFTDTTNDLISGSEIGLGQGFGGIGGGGNSGVVSNTPIGDILFDVTGDTVESEGFFVGFNKRFSALETSFQYFQREDVHDLIEINDRDTNGGVVEFNLPVGGSTAFGLIGEYRTTDFDLGDREDDDLLILLRGDRFVRQNLSLNSTLEYRDRDSTIPGQDFDEFRVRLGITYTSF